MSQKIASVAGELLTCAAKIKVDGQTFQPDGFTAFLEVELSHALPVRTCTGQAIHPSVLAKSFRSLQFKPVSINHLVRSYDRENIQRDRIVGMVVAVEIPNEPAGGWKVKKKREDAPGIRAALALGKALEGVDLIIGQHQSGRKRRTVSMEVMYFLQECWLAWMPAKETPEVPGSTEIGGGWFGIGYEQAPKELQDCWSVEKNCIVAKWNGLDVTLLLGGVDGEVQYSGVGIVNLGNEPEAEIKQLLASHPEERGVDVPQEQQQPAVADPLRALSDALAAFSNGIKKVVDA
jgi:hypothetical protein